MIGGGHVAMLLMWVFSRNQGQNQRNSVVQADLSCLQSLVYQKILDPTFSIIQLHDRMPLQEV